MYTRGQLAERAAGVEQPESISITFDGGAASGAIAAAATLTTALTGDDNDLTFTAASGIAGNDISIEYKDPGAASRPLDVSVVGNAIEVNLKTSGGVAATGTLTASGVFQNTETVTIGETEYTFVTALSTGPTVPYEVLIGANAAASLDNLKSAVNATTGEGTTYSEGTEIHPTVSATTNADTTQLFVAKTIGAAGNAIATTETGDNIAFGDTTLVGGEDVGQILSLASEIDAAIDANTAAAALVTPADADSNDGSGVVTAMAATNLSGGSDGEVALFTIEQDGLIALTGHCSTDLTGASATIEAGVGSVTTALIPLTTATTFDEDERIDRAGVLGANARPLTTPFYPVKAGDEVKLKIRTAAVDGGAATFQLYHKPFSAVEEGYNMLYQAAAAANVVVKATPGYLKGIIVGADVSTGTIEISDHASDGDGNVKILLTGSTLMTSSGGYVPIDAYFKVGITADLTNQTNITFLYR